MPSAATVATAITGITIGINPLLKYKKSSRAPLTAFFMRQSISTLHNQNSSSSALKSHKYQKLIHRSNIVRIKISEVKEEEMNIVRYKGQ